MAILNKMNISNDLTFNIEMGVDYPTAKACLAIVELYLNQNDTECLVIENNEPGAWNLIIKNWRDFDDECE